MLVALGALGVLPPAPAVEVDRAHELALALERWSALVLLEAAAAGFPGRRRFGWPILDMPATWQEKHRLLELRFTVATCRRIYSDGILVVPA